MKNRNVLFTVLGIIVLVVLMIGVFYHFRDRRTYTLNLPKLEKLESISLKQNEKNVIIDDKEKMQGRGKGKYMYKTNLREDGKHFFRIRKLTPKECWRLMRIFRPRF